MRTNEPMFDVQRRHLLGRLAFAGVAAGGPSALTASPADRPPSPLLGAFVHGLPKAELHIHFEGILTAPDVLRLAQKHDSDLPYQNIEAVHSDYARIVDTPTFLDVFGGMTSVIRTERDHYDLALRYFERAHLEGVKRIEMFFEPQLHLARGIEFETIAAGLAQAREEAASRLGLSVAYVLTFYRDHPIEQAQDLLARSDAFGDHIVGIGLDNPQVPKTAQKFERLFAHARDMGYRTTTHCMVDEANVHRHIREAIEILKVDRIDHGINVTERPELVELALDHGTGFNVCPSLFEDRVGFRDEYFRRCARAADTMQRLGIPVTLNSDDPGFFAGLYLNDVYLLTAEACGWGMTELARVARDSFDLAWVEAGERRAHKTALTRYIQAFS